MSWSDIFLLCFVVGFFLSLFSFVGGSLRLPHVHLHGHGAGGAAHGPTALAFLTWFGGAGFLLTRYSGFSVSLALVSALVTATAGSALVFWLLSRFLKDEHPLDPDDYDIIGVLGRVSSPVLPGGTGEMIYSQQGTRRGIPVRSEDGATLPRGSEVVVTRFEKGIAYVKHWDELSA